MAIKYLVMFRYMKVWLGALSFVLFFMLPWISWAQVARVHGMRLSATVNHTRLVLDLNQEKIDYGIETAEKKIIITLKHAKLATNLAKLDLTKGVVSSLVSKYRGDNLQITMFLKDQIQVKHFLLARPPRLVIDITTMKDVAKLEVAEISTAYLDAMESIDRMERKIIDQLYHDGAAKISQNSRDTVIVIDPGHGGKDPGAIGSRATREKNITLVVARKLQRILNNTKGVRAILTRNGDYYVSLRGRLKIVHSYNADLFISIHADAYKRREACGISIFALSQKGATSEAARWLAEKENASELGQAMVDKNRLLRSVLIDLSQTATVNASLDLGKKMLEAFSQVAILHSPKVEQAAFVILKSPYVPSLLVEIGFLSHGSEEKKLNQSSYQDKIVDKMAESIHSYLMIPFKGKK